MAADVGYRQADDDLDGTAVFHQAKGTGIGKLARSRDFIRIVDRDPQASCTVGDFLDVVGTAEAVEEDLRFQGISTAGNTLLFHFFLGLVFGLGKQFIVFTVISASRRLKVEVQDEEAEHDEINEGKAEADGNLHDIRPGVEAEQGNPVLDDAVNEAAAEVARQADKVENGRQSRRQDGMDEIQDRSHK